MTINQIPFFDPATFVKATVGFDNLLNTLDRLNQPKNYPPYNIINKDGTYFIEMAVAGFNEENISVELEDRVLTISGKTVDEEPKDINYLYRGLGSRAFVRKFTLAEDTVVSDASINNGMLVITINRIVPEVRKTKKIEIKKVSSSLLQEGVNK